MNEFWRQARGRLAAQERTSSWLARRIGVSRSALEHYMKGRAATPERVRLQVAVLLDIREQIAA